MMNLRILSAAVMLSAAALGADGLKPYSVQIHLHGSMSEGPGSMRGGNVQARKLGLDVLWWTDHDWRVSYHTYAGGYDFEGAGLTSSVPVPYPPGTDPALIKGEMMKVTLTPHRANGKVSDSVARMTSERAAQGARSFEVGASAPDAGNGFQSYFFELEATRMRMKRSLASRVRVEFSIFPEIETDKKTMVGVRFDLSQQPPDMARGAIIYVLTGLTDGELAAMSTASTKYVRLDFKRGQWNKYSVNLTEDAKRLGLGGEDNSLGSASFGVLTTGQRARAFFDDFQMHHELAGERLRDAARRMAAALEREYGVTNYVSQEFSYLAHMNPLGDIPMIDHIKHPKGLTSAEAVEFTHRYGGVISLNHYFGGKGEGLQRRVKELVADRAFGSDLLECNPGQLRNFLPAWDELSKAGVYVTGDGVSDSHTSTGGWFTGSNFVSWVWAKSKSQSDLIDGLRRGNVYFGDPAAYRGQVSLSTPDGHKMGQVVETQKRSHQVTLRLTALPAGTRVKTIAGADQKEQTTTQQGDFERIIDVDTTSSTFVRVEAWLADGKPLVFSNPIYFVRSGTPVVSSNDRRAKCE